ncbi:GDP-mannose 4,6-dehydratase, partial [Spirulina sp. 06S082]|uniref:GDP-mannose 4,6-dehydratase n=1 Tax=Spirulina sp. 06S082 TaxID=3110248 RepID=UPI002B21A44B
VRELVAMAFNCVDLDWQNYVEIDPKFLRSDEHFQLVANPTKARENLQWQFQTDLSAIIEKMVAKDLQRIQLGQIEPIKTRG